MSEFYPIYKGRDFYVPAFDVKVGGSDLPMETHRDVSEVKFSDSLGEFDTFEITVNNWDEENLDFKYTGSKNGTSGPRDELFDPGQEIELWMGYYRPIDPSERHPNTSEPLQLMLAGVITRLTPNFPSSGQPTLKISGQSALIKMINQQETHVYDENKSDSEIAEQVGNRGNLTLGNMRIPVRTNEEAKSQEPRHSQSVLQHNQYDILFLLELAHQNGYDLVLQQDENDGEPQQYLYFGPSTQEPPVSYQLEWGRSLISIQPTLTTARQVNELTVRSWNSTTKQPISVTVNRSELPTRPMHDLDRLYRIQQGFSERHEILVDQPFRDEPEARQYALARLESLSKDLVTTRASTPGTTGLRVGRKALVSGLGITFDGEYFITSTTHIINASGYITEFEARLEEDNT
jgi:phage protein D